MRDMYNDWMEENREKGICNHWQIGMKTAKHMTDIHGNRLVRVGV